MTDFGYDLAQFMTARLSELHERAVDGAAADLAQMPREAVFAVARERFAASCEYPGDGDLIRAIPLDAIGEGDVVDGLWRAICALPIRSAGPECVSHVGVWKAMRQ